MVQWHLYCTQRHLKDNRTCPYLKLRCLQLTTKSSKIQIHLLKHSELDISCQNARGTFTATSGCSPPAWISNVGLDVQKVYVKRAPCALMSSSLHCSVTCGINGGTAQPIKYLSCHKHSCAYTMPIRRLTHILRVNGAFWLGSYKTRV